MRFRLGLFAVAALLCATPAVAQDAGGVARTYYIAADELNWNYAPGPATMTPMGGSGYEKYYLGHGPRQIGTVYRKALYREYTDATFAHLKPRPPSEAYLGTVGPVLHAEVGDSIVVVFRNHGTHPYSIHAHGVRYEKSSEGAPDAGVADTVASGSAVPPGGTFTYRWSVPERAGPGPADPSSVVWLYHSHVNERRDVNAGLIGAIVVTRKGMARPDGTPTDVDHEFVALFMLYDENYSWFIDRNIAQFVADKKHLKRTETIPFDPTGHFDPLLATGFAASNFRWTVNGYQYSRNPLPVMHVGERVRWYALTLGEGFNFHTAHWHGNTVLSAGQRTDVLSLAPAQMLVADMVPDNPGIWMLHCHVSEHMEAGMAARYQVLP